MFRRGWLGLAAVLALAQAAPAFAADNLIQSPRGDDKSFTLYYLHSRPDGTTVVEQVTASLKSATGRAGLSDTLFNGPLDNLTIRWSPDGLLSAKDAPFNHEKKSRMLLVLQGEFVAEVSNGVQMRVKPGELLLQEDTTGNGHKLRCEPPKGSLGCVQLTMDAADPATFFANLAR